jgi:UDP-galactopyranose mutase
MALDFSRQLTPRAVIYDCMDELAGFLGAPPEMRLREQELLQRADVVFTGGQALYESKRDSHANIHVFPSSVDVAHFARARAPHADPDDQKAIPHPRLGFFGVLDERLDTALIAQLAAQRPDWHLVLVGPTAKIEGTMLPSGPNIHYLGPKPYANLPEYLAGWDVALLPFAQNAATRFISPTKTPEYLAAGKPVVSTPIRDVIRPYGVRGLVKIADSAGAFVQAIETALTESASERQREADAFLTQTSWDGTWTRMYRLIATTVARRDAALRSDTLVPEPGVA